MILSLIIDGYSKYCAVQYHIITTVPIQPKLSTKAQHIRRIFVPLSEFEVNLFQNQNVHNSKLPFNCIANTMRSDYIAQIFQLLKALNAKKTFVFRFRIHYVVYTQNGSFIYLIGFVFSQVLAWIVIKSTMSTQIALSSLDSSFMPEGS